MWPFCCSYYWSTNNDNLDALFLWFSLLQNKYVNLDAVYLQFFYIFTIASKMSIFTTADFTTAAEILSFTRNISQLHQRWQFRCCIYAIFMQQKWQFLMQCFCSLWTKWTFGHSFHFCNANITIYSQYFYSFHYCSSSAALYTVSAAFTIAPYCTQSHFGITHKRVCSLMVTHSPPPTASAPACMSRNGPETRWIVGRCWAHCSWNTDPDKPWKHHTALLEPSTHMIILVLLKYHNI